MKYKQIFIILTISSLLFVTKMMANESKTIQIVLIPKQQITISSKVSTSVTAYTTKIGEQIEKGKLLVTLDQKRYQEILNGKNANVESAKAQLEYSKKRLKENEKLFTRGAIGKTVIADSRLKVQLDKATLDAAKSTKLLALYNLKSCSIYAPFTGRLVKQNVKEGEYVNIGEPICEFLQDNKLLAVIHVSSSQITKIHLGNTFPIKIVESKLFVNATVVEISPNIDPGSHTFEVKAEIDNSDYKLRAGMIGVIKENTLIKGN